MTRDEILAAIDLQQARLDQANTLIETATAAKAQAEADLVAGETQRLDAQAEIARLNDLLANLPRDWNAADTHHAPADRHGLKIVRADTHALFVPPFEARSGRVARTLQVYEGARPLNVGEWERFSHAIDAFPDRQHLIAWNTGDGSNVRGKQVTPAQVEAGARRLRESIARDRPRMERMWRARLALGHIDQTIDRPNHENNGYPYDWAYGIPPLPNISASESVRLSNLMADANREWWEFVLEVAADTLGDKFPETRWAFNLVDGGTGRPGAAELVERAWPRVLPPGTRMVLTLDHYFKNLASPDHLRRCLAVLDDLAPRLPGVVALGIDEIGGHLPAAVPVGQIPGLRAAAADYGRVLADWTASDRPISHVCWFETESPNGGRDVYTRVWLDPEVVGPLNGPVTGADGRLFRSGYPQMAQAFL